MTDGDLLALGCAVSFFAVAGAYVFMRERFLANARARAPRSGGRSKARRAA